MIEVRTGRDGARIYRARVYHRGRYVASRTFARKRDAQEWERRQVDGLRSGVWSDPGAAERPVQDWCDACLVIFHRRHFASRRASAESISRVLGRGTVPIPGTVVDELTDLQAQSAPSELVFPSANSTPLRNRNFRRDSFDAATAALGLTITPHNLRDTAASLAIQAGASVVAVARLLGHESAATTLNHYAGLFPTDLDDVSGTPRCRPREAIGGQ